MNPDTIEIGLQTAEFFKKISEAVFVTRIISNKFSQKIIHLLNDSNPLTVTEIFIKLRMLQSVTSQHLAILRRAGIVINKRHGKQIFYELNYDKILKVKYFIDSLVPADL